MSSQRYISDTLKQKKKHVRTIKTSAFFALILLLIIGFIFLLRAPQIQIRDVKINGNIFVPIQEIQDKTNSVLDSSIIGIIPKRNIFLFSAREVESKIKENPAIVSVKIKKDFFNTILIEITEQEKEMVYCTSLERSECYYINKTGFLYAKISDFIIPEQEIIIYSEQGTKKIEDTLLEKELYTDVVSFIKSSARYDVRIGQVFIKSDGLIEFVTRDNVRLITSVYDDFAKDFDNLVALFEKQVLVKDQLSLVEYIDLRFGNKVFYKNKTN